MDVVEPAGRFVAGMPPRVRALVRLALTTFEWSPFPRRFSRLPADRRAAHIERMERSRVAARRDVALLLKTLSSLAYARHPEVQRAVGSAPRCELAGEPPEPAWPPLDLDALAAPDGGESCDVAIVGSGAAGASAARVLAEAGLDVVVLEEGDYHDAATYPPDPLEALPALYRDAGLTFCEGRPAIPLPVGRCVGGTTVVNSGTCLRTPQPVLESWREEHGIDWAPELGADFDALSRDLRIRFVDLASAGRNGQLCHEGAEAIGAANGPIARNAGEVVRCGTCPVGCATDAKQATHVSELPRAATAGARVRAGVRVREVVLERGRARGVRCDGGYEVRARAVLLCAGALGTPELLLRQGIANRSGEVGRRLRIHPACWVGARFPEPVRGWDGVMQSWHVGEWADRGLFLEATFTPLALGAHWLRGAGERFKERIERYDRLAIIGVHLSDRSEGRVGPRGPGLRIRYGLTREDAERLRFGIARAAEIHLAAGAEEVYPQIGRVEALGSKRDVAALEAARIRPGDLRLEAFHPMGTARMGADERVSVVDASGESHDVPGLYVADASILPSSLGVNPMLTIMACARRIARGMAERLA